MSDAWVKLQGNLGNQFLVAYIVTDLAVESEKIKQHLTQVLPGFMVPNAYIKLAALPLNSNGKVDNSQLPEYDYSEVTCYYPPENRVEEVIQDIWQSVLDTSQVSVLSKFF